MKILLTGATGFIGQHLLRALINDSHEVTAAVRKPCSVRVPKAKTLEVDFARDHDIDTWTKRVEGFDVVVNSVGIIREHGTQRYRRPGARCANVIVEPRCSAPTHSAGRPTAITMQQLIQTLRTWLELGTGRYAHIPYCSEIALGKVFGFAGNTPLTSVTVQMLRRGNTGDVLLYSTLFHRAPIDLDSALAAVPPQQSDRWHATLYFLLPALRLSLALVWIVTGIVSLFVYPVAESYELLARVGVPAPWSPAFLFGAALVDIALGLALLLRWRVAWVGALHDNSFYLSGTMLVARRGPAIPHA